MLLWMWHACSRLLSRLKQLRHELLLRRIQRLVLLRIRLLRLLLTLTQRTSEPHVASACLFPAMTSAAFFMSRPEACTQLQLC